jgi:hypothetical protein
MGRRQRLFTAAVAAACTLIFALPGHALASGTQETVLQDDTWLIYSSPQRVAQALYVIKAEGVDRVRISVVWSLIAPHPQSSRRPKFDATNPAAYPQGVWDRYDTVVRIARSLGVRVYFQLTAPAPNWATPPRKIAQGYRWSHDPSAKEYGEFVQAVGRRYRGLVDYWGIWNEPNIGGWMTPQWRTVRGGQKVEASPAIYRGMLDAAWRALQKTGHGHDTILIGETAAYGFAWKGYGADMDPLTFVRALYCLSAAYRPLTGKRATEVGCPSSGSRAAFAAAHPGLFAATGWAHHPYDFFKAPSTHLRDPNAADLADLSRLDRALDRTFRSYRKRAGFPIYVTEWGYQSNPPDPFVKFSLAQQAVYLNEGEYMAWRDPRVRAFGQFLLVDDSPFTQYHRGSRGYWSSFQSGLIELGGTQKPAYFAFRIPIWLPNPRHGRSVAVWGQLRPANHTTLQTGTLQFRAQGSRAWANVTVVQTRNREGFVFTHVALPSAGLMRLAWLDPATGQVEYSRAAPVK